MIGHDGVFSAADTVLDRRVAIALTPSVNIPSSGRARALQNAERYARVTHQNLVAIRDLGEASGHLFIVTELWEGEDLVRTIARRDALTLEQKLAMMRQICDGVRHLHERGVAHGDIRAATIVLLAADQVKLLPPSVTAMAAPERVGRDAAQEADVHAAAVVFRELLGESSELAGSAPEAFRDALARALLDDPGSRPPIEELWSGLGPARAPASVDVLPVPSPLDQAQSGQPLPGEGQGISFAALLKIAVAEAKRRMGRAAAELARRARDFKSPRELWRRVVGAPWRAWISRRPVWLGAAIASIAVVVVVHFSTPRPSGPIQGGPGPEPPDPLVELRESVAAERARAVEAKADRLAQKRFQAAVAAEDAAHGAPTERAVAEKHYRAALLGYGEAAAEARRAQQPRVEPERRRKDAEEAPVLSGKSRRVPSTGPLTPEQSKMADDAATLGQLFSARGDAERARREYLRALDLDPNHAEAKEGLGRLEEVPRQGR